MKKTFLFLSMGLSLLAVHPMWGQNTPADTTKKSSSWTVGASLGADFAQLLQINPRPGSGQNRLGVGGALNVFANYNSGRLAWDTKGNWQMGLQRFGAGPIAGGESIPFQKAIDVLMLASSLGYRAKPASKLFYTADFNFISQVTPTFQGPADYPGLFLTGVDNATLLAQFFSPAIINLSLGLDYKPNAKFAFFYSPLGAKWVVVEANRIARLGVHGNPVTKNAAGVVTSFENVDAQLGSLLRANYADKFLDDRMNFTSSLLLFSNYLRNPQNIDVNWNNELGFTIVKGLQLSLLANIFYDDDMRMQITDYDFPNGVRPGDGGKRVSITQQLLLKYGVTF